jgi:hypothetical protein
MAALPSISGWCINFIFKGAINGQTGLTGKRANLNWMFELTLTEFVSI